MRQYKKVNSMAMFVAATVATAFITVVGADVDADAGDSVQFPPKGGTYVDNDPAKDIIYTAADYPDSKPKYYDSTQYPLVSFVQEIRDRIEAYQPFCLVGLFEGNMVLNTQDIKEMDRVVKDGGTAVIDRDDSKPPRDARVSSVFKYTTFMNVDDSPAFPLLTPKKQDDERPNMRVLLNFAEIYKFADRLKADNQWVSPQELQKGRVKMKVCGRLVAENAVTLDNKFNIQVNRALVDIERVPEIMLESMEVLPLEQQYKTELANLHFGKQIMATFNTQSQDKHEAGLTYTYKDFLSLMSLTEKAAKVAKDKGITVDAVFDKLVENLY